MSDTADDDVAGDTDPRADSGGAGVEPAADAETEATETDAAEEAVAEDAVAEAVEAPAVAMAGRAGGALRWIAVAVLVLGLIGASFEGWLLYDHHRRSVAAAQALAAAEKFAQLLTSVDPETIDQNFNEILDGATGEFKDVYRASGEVLRQQLIENKAAAHGTVIDAAVKSSTPDRVEVLLFIDQTVSNKSVPRAMMDRSRISMTMEKVDGRWLAAKVDMP